LIRQLIDSGLSGSGLDDQEGDLAAIEESSGVLAESDDLPARGPDERSRREPAARRIPAYIQSA
jgi:hypothetical protein